MVSLLGLIFDIVELDSSEWYNGDYNYWTVRESDGKTCFCLIGFLPNLLLAFRTVSGVVYLNMYRA